MLDVESNNKEITEKVIIKKCKILVLIIGAIVGLILALGVLYLFAYLFNYLWLSRHHKHV